MTSKRGWRHVGRRGGIALTEERPGYAGT